MYVDLCFRPEKRVKTLSVFKIVSKQSNSDEYGTAVEAACVIMRVFMTSIGLRYRKSTVGR